MNMFVMISVWTALTMVGILSGLFYLTLVTTLQIVIIIIIIFLNVHLSRLRLKGVLRKNFPRSHD